MTPKLGNAYYTVAITLAILMVRVDGLLQSSPRRMYGEERGPQHHIAVGAKKSTTTRRLDGPHTRMALSVPNEAMPTDETKKTALCVIQSQEFPQVASDLADRFSLPLLSISDILQNNDDDECTPFTSVISVDPYTAGNVQDYSIGLSLMMDQPLSRASRKKKSRPRAFLSMKPIFVDFVPPVTSRLGQRTGQPDLLLKAVKGVPNAIVYDCTAGLGQDSRLMALAGAAHVHMVERDPIVAFLLEDALRRLLVLSEQVENDVALKNTATNLYNCLSLECAEAAETLDRKESTDVLPKWPPDIVYLDPMFPARKKSASVKKNMQVLHRLLGSQHVMMDDTVVSEQPHAALLRTAYTVAKKRAVVKRPIHAPLLLPVEELRPSYSVTGSINRWDVYVKS